MRAVRYSVDEALASLWRSRQSAMLSTGTIALALFVLGGFLIGTTNLQRLGAEWSSLAELSVYLRDDVTEAEQHAVDTALASSAIVESREYVPKAAALARFHQTFGELADSMDSLGRNPLPASYEVRLKPVRADAEVEALAAGLRGAAGVADVRYDQQWLARLRSAIALVGRVGLLVGAVFSLAASLTVAAVVRLTLLARRDELEIMQLVGAPAAYLRGPFVMEGILQGGMGALAALVALGVTFVALRARYLAPLAAALNLSAVHFLPWELSVLLVAGGMLVGCVGGVVAAWSR
ncbi:MAG: ABC transporter permease [Acidobacteriota bacterium]